MGKERLDITLVIRALVESREKAQALIMSGLVYINGQKASKSSILVKAEDCLEIRGAPHPYVSRGALKLEKALDAFGLDVRGIVAMDVGASTGGFTDLLLQRGAAHVFSVDVGYGQLDWKLRSNARVTVMERTNARYLKPEDFSLQPTMAVMDVSFISILKILPAIFEILGAQGQCVSLIKPQFEAGKTSVGKKGVVRDPAVHVEVVARIIRGVMEFGWHCKALSYSPIKGPEGNIEFLAYILPGKAESPITDAEIQQMVASAHTAL